MHIDLAVIEYFITLGVIFRLSLGVIFRLGFLLLNSYDYERPFLAHSSPSVNSQHFAALAIQKTCKGS
jgi:hypothetical protein